MTATFLNRVSAGANRRFRVAVSGSISARTLSIRRCNSLGCRADLELQRPLGKAVDYFHVLLRYRRSRVILHGASLVAAESPRFTVHGTLGSFIKFGMDTQEESLKVGQVPGSPGWGYDPQTGTLTMKRENGFEKRRVSSIPGNYLAYYEGVRDAIITGASSPVTAEDGLAVINVLETAVRSSAARTELPFNQIGLIPP
jgi:predicted dehydrogenase